MIDDAADQGARVLLRKFVEFWERLLTEGGFSAGCPVVAAAIGSDEADAKLSAEAGAILGRWCAALTRAFTHDGFDEPCAASLAVMSIAALEGAIVLSRSTASIDPLREVGDQLEFLIKARNSWSATRSRSDPSVAGRQRLDLFELQRGSPDAQAPGARLGHQHLGARLVDVALAHHGAVGERRIQLT